MHTTSFLNHAINELLQQRQALLVLFCELASIEIGSPDKQCDKQQKFCQLMLDYATLWEFEIYNELMERQLVQKDMHQAAIAHFDRLALAFNDDFDAGHCFSPSELEYRLDELGQALANRLEAEDHILNGIRSDHGLTG